MFVFLHALRPVCRISVRSGLMLDANDWREHPSTLIDAYH